MLTTAARLMYFIAISMVEVIAYITSITLISTIQAIANNMKPKNQAANGLTKFL